MNILNTPIKIKNIEIENRLVMPPMATAKSDSDGKVTEQLCEYYNEKSQGGYIGLIITEHCYVSPEGKASKGQLSIADDSVIDGLRKLTSIIHNNGSKVFAQISHAGSAASKNVTGMEVIGVSAVINDGMVGKYKELPKEMTKEQIKQTVKNFADGARRAKQAGFDGVEIHSAHGYLLNQFYSPLTNRRNDEYGSSTMENRLRIHKEIIQAVQAEVGEDFPVALRLGGCDYTDGGSTIADSVEAALLFESYGIDLLDISGGLNGYIIPGKTEPGYFSDMSEQIKKKVSIPVILTGGIVSADVAECLLQKEKTDFIGIGRAILKNSCWAKDAMLKNNYQ